MANLLPCPDCGRKVSPRAASCPQCGAPIATAPVASTPTVAPSTPIVVRETGSSGGNVIAALLSLFVPGLGQLVQGRFAACMLWWGFEFLGALLVFASVASGSPGIFLLGILGAVAIHLWQVSDAATYDRTKPGGF